MEIEDRITKIEQMVAELHAALIIGREPSRPDLDDYRQALEAMKFGNMAPLRLYLRRGGKIPAPETVYPTTSRPSPSRRSTAGGRS